MSASDLPPKARSPALTPYRGRFAPSPTGPLHFGSLVAAVGSFLAARQAGGQWLVRIEDLDPPREVPGSAELILRTLEAFGFEWDEPVMWQSRRHPAYEEAAARLQSAGLAYECTCSRTEIAAALVNSRANSRDSSRRHEATDELHYPGWCRQGPLFPERERALRFLAPAGPVAFLDTLQGEITGDVATDCGDFVIRRRDGRFAYQLAVVVDDAAQGITHVVRGADLLTSTLRQLSLQRALGLPTPVYTHLPLAVDKSQAKLSKSVGSAALDVAKPSVQLWQALDFLRQEPPAGMRSASLRELWDWAVPCWKTAALCGIRSLELGTADS